MKILFPLLMLARAFAADSVPDTDMHALAQEVNALQQLLFSPADFQAATNEKSVQDALSGLSSHLENLHRGTFAGDPALQANLSLLTLQVSEARQGFNAGQKAYSRYRLESGLQLCIACHTRTKGMDFTLPVERLKNASPLERADFFFATRQFEKGREAYLTALRSEKGELSPVQRRKALLSLAVYHARVKQDPAGGKQLFAELAGDKKSSPGERGELQAWAAAFSAWAQEKPPLESQLKAADWLRSAQALLSKKAKSPVVQELRATVLLHRVIESAQANETQKGEALYSLGQAYLALDYPLYFRFGDLYFKTCIQERSHSPLAQRCYSALQESVRKNGGDEVELLQLRKQVF
jgi:hypothetical protein